jgi:plastocyanin
MGGSIMLRLSLLLLVTSGVFAYLAVSPGLAMAGGGCHAEGVGDARTNAVEMRDSCLYPVIARVEAGESVTWTNRDSVPHTVTGANMSWGSPDAMSGSREVRFEQPGVYPYYCIAHPWMAGVVVVGDASGPGLLAGGAPQVVRATSATPPEAPAARAAAAVSTPGSTPEYFLAGAVVSGLAGIAAGSVGFALGRRRPAD